MMMTDSGRSSDAAELTRHLAAKAESQAVLDVGRHLGDRIFDLLRMHAMTMPTVSAAIGAGLVAMQQVYAETVEFAVNSMEGDEEDQKSVRLSAADLARDLLGSVDAANECSVGVGDGRGRMFVRGSYDAVKRVQTMILALEPLATALRDWGDEMDHPDSRDLWDHPLAMNITLGDIRRAAAAVEMPSKPTTQKGSDNA